MSGNNESLIGIGELFSRTWDVFKRRWLTLLVIFILGFILTFAAIGLPIAGAAWLDMPGISAVGIVTGFIVVFWYMAAFVFAVTNEQLGVFAAFGASWRRILSFTWLATVFGFIVMGGFMLLIIPGIIFGVWFYFSMFILAAEDERGMAAMLKSKAYIEGYWWAVFLRLFLLFFLVPLGLNLAISLLVWFISELTGDPIITMVIMVILAIPVLLFTLFSMLATYLIYDDLRTIKKNIAFKATTGTKTKWLIVALLGYAWLPITVMVYGAKKLVGELIPFDDFNFEMGTGLPDIKTTPKAESPTKDSQPRQTPATPEVSPAASGSMVLINGGCFQMGDVFGDGGSDERPAHKVCLNDFWLDAKEVSQGDYEQATGSNPSRFKADNKPVTNVTWLQARGYCARAGKRLPAEAEWEFAARAGGKDSRWSGTSEVEKLADYAWHDRSYSGGPHAIGLKKPNALGLYDMTGNVWEMVADRYHSRYYASSPEENPKGPKTGDARVMRGGAWFTQPADQLRTTVRYITREDKADDSIGFRCAK